MLKIAVVDDEIVFVESLINKITAVCEKLNLKFKIDKYSNGFDILENYSKYHLIFLDIEMPSIDGIATAKRINELKGSAEIPFIVYVTSHDELVFDALKSFPYSFIRKSKIESDLYECINRINNSFEELHKTIVLHTERKDIPIVIGDIIYLEKIKNYVETVLQPKLQGDGGWVEFVGLDGDELTLIFRGECSKCLILNRCTAWIEEQIKKDLKKNVKVNAIRKKPYFQDI